MVGMQRRLMGGWQAHKHSYWMPGWMTWGLSERGRAATVAACRGHFARCDQPNNKRKTMSKHTLRQILAILGGILGAGLFWLFVTVLFSL